jgi:ribulose 1,5-bisphosphate synthetase/thiazole synthase
MERRQLIKIGALGILSSCVIDKNYTFHNQSNIIKEINDIQIVDSYDVIVCGGGPAGIAAAISAARNGAKTCLIELYGCLGGIWTTGLLSNIIDYQNKAGIMAEIIDRLNKSKAQIQAGNYDSEAMKLILEQMCSEAGVHIRLY